jgi:hypothetical protein
MLFIRSTARRFSSQLQRRYLFPLSIPCSMGSFFTVSF